MIYYLRDGRVDRSRLYLCDFPPGDYSAPTMVEFCDALDAANAKTKAAWTCEELDAKEDRKRLMHSLVVGLTLGIVVWVVIAALFGLEGLFIGLLVR